MQVDSQGCRGFCSCSRMHAAQLAAQMVTGSAKRGMQADSRLAMKKAFLAGRPASWAVLETLIPRDAGWPLGTDTFCVQARMLDGASVASAPQSFAAELLLLLPLLLLDRPQWLVIFCQVWLSSSGTELLSHTQTSTPRGHTSPWCAPLALQTDLG